MDLFQASDLTTRTTSNGPSTDGSTDPIQENEVELVVKVSCVISIHHSSFSTISEVSDG
jgi:hypothetical protein